MEMVLCAKQLGNVAKSQVKEGFDKLFKILCIKKYKVFWTRKAEDLCSDIYNFFSV